MVRTEHKRNKSVLHQQPPQINAFTPRLDPRMDPRLEHRPDHRVDHRMDPNQFGGTYDQRQSPFSKDPHSNY